MRTYIKVPIKIITPKIAQNKQDSIFYAGKVIARVKVRNRTYALTTAGEYKFSLKGEPISFDSSWQTKWDPMIGAGAPGRTILSKLTDAKIKTLSISNWGWFGINVWETQPNIPGLPQCLLEPSDVYSEYDEAMNAFIEFVEKDLEMNIK